MPHPESHSHHTPARASSQAERREKKTSSSSRPSSSSSGAAAQAAGVSKSSSSASSSHRRSHNRDDHRHGHSKRRDDTSPSASPSSSKTTRSDALREVAGDRVRHAKCPPEYLEGIAHREDQQVKFVTGSEAATFFLKYIGGSLDNDTSSLRSNSTRGGSQAIVFAVTVWDYDRKCVDYYMTWRGKEKYHGLKEDEVATLDDEFRRVARRIDKDYKSFRRAGSIASSTSRHSHKSSRSSRHDRSYSRSLSPSRTSRRRSPSPTPHKSSRASKDLSIKPPRPHEDLKRSDEQDPAPLPEPPVSAASSVISLPYLNMIRGVPLGNRLPLVVTNPDRLSMLSEVDVPLADPDAGEAQAEQADNPAIAITPPDTHPQTPFDTNFSASSGLTPLMKSSASIHSTDTRSSRSSRSSQSTRDSPEMNGGALEEEDERERPEFLIVLLGDRLEKEGLSWHGMERQASTRTQHRTNTKDKASPWIGPLAKADIVTPRPRKKRLHAHLQNHLSGYRDQNSSDSDASYEEGSWKDSPVVPLKPLLETLGSKFLASSTASPVEYSPYGSNNGSNTYTPTMPIPNHFVPPPGSMMASPAPSAMISLPMMGYAASAASSGTPRNLNLNGGYIPAYVGSMGGSPGPSRPVSRVVPSMGQYTPYVMPGY